MTLIGTRYRRPLVAMNFLFRARRFMLSFLMAVLLLSAFLPSKAQASEPWTAKWEPAQLVNGSPVLFRITAPAELTSLEGTWLGHTLSFRFGQACNCWYAIAGVSLNTKPGKYPLSLQGRGASTVKATFSSAVTVSEKRYPSTSITVAPKYVQPPAETEARIEEEQALKKRIFSSTAPEPFWSGRFEPPANAEVSGVFGSARVFNGVKNSPHTGLDFRVTTGTPIAASNSGTIILARNLYFEGNCVMIDHGQGLITLYLHLSEFKVKEGDHVQGGKIVGLSGGTGRATAPHLHFAVRWQGVYLDPGTLLSLNLP
jgi:murein DD-endopeptidase MepM/ murein hydrolase activator NlpD